jgi:uncharacterized membrane protein
MEDLQVSDRLAWIVVGAVAFVWVVTSLILPLAVHGYTPPPSIGTVMGGMASGAAAYLFAKRGKDDDDEDENDPAPKKRRKPRRPVPVEEPDGE